MLLEGARLCDSRRRSLRTESMKCCRSGKMVSGVQVLRIFSRESSVGSLLGWGVGFGGDHWSKWQRNLSFRMNCSVRSISSARSGPEGVGQKERPKLRSFKVESGMVREERLTTLQPAYCLRRLLISTWSVFIVAR